MPNSAISKELFASSCLGDVLTGAIACLEKAGIDHPDLDARWLVEAILQMDRTQMFLQKDRVLTAEEIERVTEAISERAGHRSVARILGEREFWGLPFGINEATLEPRPDSETLVETTLKHIGDRAADLRLLDCGTGTGCLLLSLLHELPNATGLGIDIAPRAIEQATQNAVRLNLSSRVNFRLNNWLDDLDDMFDVIISNPPYITTDVIPALMPEVRDHDPVLALDGSMDGLAAYRYLVPQIVSHLKPGGVAVVEIGYDQAPAVTGLMVQHHLVNVTVTRDLAGLDRCVTGIRSS